MGRHCVLPNCSSTDQILFQFPAEGDKRREKWIEFVRTVTGIDFKPKISSKLCRNHFESELFEGKLMKPFAIPTISSQDRKRMSEEIEETLYKFKKLRPNWNYQRLGADFLLFQLKSQTVPQIAHSIKISSNQHFTCYSHDRIIDSVPDLPDLSLIERLLKACDYCDFFTFEGDREIENLKETEAVIENQELEIDQDSNNIVYAPEEDLKEMEFIEEAEEIMTIEKCVQEDHSSDGYLIINDDDGKRNFQCTKCNKDFSRKYSLDHHFKHSSAHRNERSTTDLKCDECSSTFYDFTTLKRHKLMVHDQQKTPCVVCSKEFNAYHMNLHMKRHLKLNFACPHCPKRIFESNYLLQEHIKARHSNQKFYECDCCNETFRTKHTLLKHLNSSHRNVSKPFLCTKCGMRVLSKQALSSHHRKCFLTSDKEGKQPLVKKRSKC